MRKIPMKLMALKARCAAIWRDRRGTAVLEMGIMTPVLLIIGLGVMEFGNLIYKRHLIENGVRDAARYVGGMLGACSSAGVLDTTVGTEAANIANTATIDGSGSDRVQNWGLDTATPGNNIKCDIVTATYMDSGSPVTLRGSGIGGPGNLIIVRVFSTVNYGTIDLGFLGILDKLGSGFNSITFTVEHKERYYGTR